MHTLRPPFRPLAALTLFLLAPLIGEYLLGNIPINLFWLMVVLAPLYGAGALLVRETAVRLGAGWPGVLLLGLAYGVVEEALVTQSLFNPNYLGLRLLDYGHVPALGIGLWWTVFVLGLHTVWSTAAAIALTEALWSRHAAEPWLRGWALPGVALVFALGCAVTAAFQPASFMASPGQFAGAAVVVALLVGATIWLGRRPTRTPLPGTAPHPLVPGALTFVALSLFLLTTWTMGLLPAWANVAAMLALLATPAAAALAWSRRAGWGAAHRLAVAGGAVLAYCWWGFVQVPSIPGATPMIDLIGNAVFVAGALALLALARKRLRTA